MLNESMIELMAVEFLPLLEFNIIYISIFLHLVVYYIISYIYIAESFTRAWNVIH